MMGFSLNAFKISWTSKVGSNGVKPMERAKQALFLHTLRVMGVAYCGTV